MNQSSEAHSHIFITRALRFYRILSVRLIFSSYWKLNVISFKTFFKYISSLLLADRPTPGYLSAHVAHKLGVDIMYYMLFALYSSCTQCLILKMSFINK